MGIAPVMRPRMTPKALVTALLLVVLSLSVWWLCSPRLGELSQTLSFHKPDDTRKPQTYLEATSITTDLLEYFADYPLGQPYQEVFGELGRRSRIIRDWLSFADSTEDDATRAVLLTSAEAAALQHFPFLAKSPRNPASESPLSDLRASLTPGSAGIVIPTSDSTLRFAGHLISSLRTVLASTLPIEIVYAGDQDLSAHSRTFLASLAADLTFLDITTVFDDSTLDLAHGGWAIKPFAALASRFELVILLDADAVLLQPPEVLLRHSALSSSGALLFHDRLLWQHGFPERHAWWHSQIRRPSAALARSLVWTEEFAEEADSGLVVLDKSRADVLVGMLHVCWQNTRAVRDEATYRLTYGDKESWWLGLEMAGAKYEFERHYGAVVGWPERDDDDDDDKAEREGGGEKVCSFVIAHVDEEDRLLWYNGGLMKNKGRAEMKGVYEVPTRWMVDGEWRKGATKQDMSCMVGREAKELSEEETKILSASIREAQRIDASLAVGKR